MEIITASVGILFALCLAALAVTPTLIGVYLEVRAQKRHDAQQNVFEFPAVYPPSRTFQFTTILAKGAQCCKTQVTKKQIPSFRSPFTPRGMRRPWRRQSTASPGWTGNRVAGFEAGPFQVGSANMVSAAGIAQSELIQKQTAIAK